MAAAVDTKTPARTLEARPGEQASTNVPPTPHQSNKTTPPLNEKAKPLPVLTSYCLVEKRGLHQILEIRTQGKTVLSVTEVEEENLKIIGLDKIGVFIEMDLAGIKR